VVSSAQKVKINEKAPASTRRTLDGLSEKQERHIQKYGGEQKVKSTNHQQRKRCAFRSLALGSFLLETVA